MQCLPTRTNTRNLITAVLLVCWIIAFTAQALGQNDCATKIQEAQKFYDQGMIEEIPQMLAPCMAGWFYPGTENRGL